MSIQTIGSSACSLPWQIVLADGTITDANAQQNSDLFWALKGGGSNFGNVSIPNLFKCHEQSILI